MTQKANIPVQYLYNRKHVKTSTIKENTGGGVVVIPRNFGFCLTTEKKENLSK